jgi:hypothetical protein
MFKSFQEPHLWMFCPFWGDAFVQQLASFRPPQMISPPFVSSTFFCFFMSQSQSFGRIVLAVCSFHRWAPIVLHLYYPIRGAVLCIPHLQNAPKTTWKNRGLKFWTITIVHHFDIYGRLYAIFSQNMISGFFS